VVTREGCGRDVVGVGPPDARDVEVSPDVAAVAPHGEKRGSDPSPPFSILPIVLQVNGRCRSIVATRCCYMRGISEDSRVFLQGFQILAPGT